MKKYSNQVSTFQIKISLLKITARKYSTSSKNKISIIFEVWRAINIYFLLFKYILYIRPCFVKNFISTWSFYSLCLLGSQKTMSNNLYTFDFAISIVTCKINNGRKRNGHRSSRILYLSKKKTFMHLQFKRYSKFSFLKKYKLCLKWITLGFQRGWTSPRTSENETILKFSKISFFEVPELALPLQQPQLIKICIFNTYCIT